MMTSQVHLINVRMLSLFRRLGTQGCVRYKPFPEEDIARIDQSIMTPPGLKCQFSKLQLNIVGRVTFA